MEKQMMKAAVLDRPLSIEVRDVPVPEPRPDEALVKVHCIGICGSDVHYYEHGRIGRYEVKQPIILGHEVAGTVVKVGSAVTNVAVGDRVAVEPGVTCGRCDYCKSGRYNLCPDVVFMATPPVDGAWADYVAVRSDFLFKLPEAMSFEEGALLEPLSVGIHAMTRGRVKPSDRVLVTGLGPIGLLALEAAKLFGVTEIYGSDVMDSRRALAMEMGAAGVLNPAGAPVKEQLDRLTGGEGVDVIIETSGSARAIADTIGLTKRGGRIVLVGLPTSDAIPLDIPALVDAELDVYGVFRYANTYPAAIQLLSRREHSIAKTITHRFPLSRIREAVETAQTQKNVSIKIMIYPNEEMQSNGGSLT
ncbi:NAD(P)-dependent alcohol dehydrogenase [Paenibacillus ehimensis]|uniref:NAD(P)-dependent alcohol dehydrogenase n=1 Tax=Paenibacillus ehimensis TaxID=79264 RepID=A0ABT8VA13_9BACL|nr:NAD(P)-dependent alcohol dehydrogenase [Paenibacillus ehimensis]MDO3677806.1 NAD(P)-dependent alcohol dehydrogenase [Paenibacillus ehimensis]MEC0209278.1 NAD(P)-dependent alcohol dehydrogenase [Paenibacillus ehimensis]